MISKTDLQAVLDEMRTEEHRTRPEPPTAEEMLAYRDGTLSAGEEARVREILLSWPELLHALMASVPADDAGDALPAAVLERQWQAMRGDLGIKRGSDRGARILTFRNAITAIAAALAIVVGVVSWQQQREARRPRMLAQTSVIMSSSRGAAGGNPITVRAADDNVLSVQLDGDARYESYRVVILDDADHEIWRGDAVRPQDETLSVFLPHSFTAPGPYWLVVHGIRDGGDETLARHGLRVK